MAEKGVPFTRECRVFEVCNPHQGKRCLKRISRSRRRCPAGSRCIRKAR
jgi:hypothetical protein